MKNFWTNLFYVFLTKLFSGCMQSASSVLYHMRIKVSAVCILSMIGDCTVVQKKKMKHPYLFQCKLLQRNETGTNNHGLLFTSISCFEIFLTSPPTWGSRPNFNFFQYKPPLPPQSFQRIRKVHLTNCLGTYFHDISIISLRVIRRRKYT